MLPFLSELNTDAMFIIQLVDLLIRVTVVLIAGLCIGIFLRRHSASVRHCWWLMTLIAVASIPFASVALPNRGPVNPLLSRVEASSAHAPRTATASIPITASTPKVTPESPAESSERLQRRRRTRRAKRPGPFAGMNSPIESLAGYPSAEFVPSVDLPAVKERPAGVVH